MRMGITTYLKLGFSAMVTNTELLESAKQVRNMETTDLTAASALPFPLGR